MFERIRLRLTLGYVGILALILVLFGGAVVVLFSLQVTLQQDQMLTREAEERQSLFYSGDFAGNETTGGSDVFGWSAISPDDRLLARTSTGSDLGLPYSSPARQAIREGKGIEDTVDGPEGKVRLVSLPVTRSGEVVAVIQTAQSRNLVSDTVQRLVLVLLFLGVLALALAAVGGLIMSARSMRPVRKAFEKQRAFIADASHELKTPLTLIRADAEVTARNPESPKARELLDHLLGETDRMNTILSDLLVLARLDAGQLPISRERFDLATVITETTDRFAARASAEGVVLVVDVADKLPVRGDRERAGQIVAALLDNALKNTPEGGRVTVTGKLHNNRAEVGVSDTGAGIAPEHLPYVFDRFYKAEAARTREGGGTGLGLAIARDFARAQDGDLTAETTSSGAVFHFSLPPAPRRP
ncbi:MAG: HAMP domain-containing sensor histidine kinase [Rubrobacteraceae bacterium]